MEPTEQTGVAVKAFTIKEGNVLLLKRRTTDVHKPGAWDIPGGRLSAGENPYKGVAREALEESGLEIEVGMPVDVNFFTRDDGQVIVMIIFLCEVKAGDVKLSEEHTEFVWADLGDKKLIPDWLRRSTVSEGVGVGEDDL